MKKTILALPALIAGVGLLSAGQVTAQILTTLHSFSATSGSPATNPDGANPQAGLLLSGDTLYGTTYNGGSASFGTAFRVNTDGTGFTNLHNFTTSSPYAINPNGTIVLSGNTLYSTAPYGGGIHPWGVVFSVNLDGTGYTNLYSFSSSSNGIYPFAGLIMSGSALYGTTSSGGSSDNGTVFRVNFDGTGFANLHSFASSSDGSNPQASLLLSGDTLFGTTTGNGQVARGTVFRVNTNGTAFTNLHSFAGSSDGANPYASLVLSSNILFGTTLNGGVSNAGTVFSLNTDGSGFTNLHSFTGGNDGMNPRAGLVLSGDTLYGTASLGGSTHHGTVFAIKTTGTDFTTLYTFTAGFIGTNSDGASPYGSLVISGNTLYGTARNYGASSKGTVFSLSFAPQLTIVSSGSNMILSWPSNYAGFDYTGFTLQSAPAITGTFTNLPSATSPYTNPIADAQQFFRLISN